MTKVTRYFIGISGDEFVQASDYEELLAVLKELTEWMRWHTGPSDSSHDALVASGTNPCPRGRKGRAAMTPQTIDFLTSAHRAELPMRASCQTCKRHWPCEVYELLIDDAALKAICQKYESAATMVLADLSNMSLNQNEARVALQAAHTFAQSRATAEAAAEKEAQP